MSINYIKFPGDVLAKKLGLWDSFVYPTEISDRLIKYEKWTRDILQLMMIVVTIAMTLIFMGVMYNIFTFIDTLPIYIMFLVIAPAWWGSRHGGWRWARFIPSLLCFAMGVYMAVGSAISPTVGMFFILAVLLAGMLLSLPIQRFVAGFSVLLIIGLNVFVIGRNFVEYLGTNITITFIMIGVVIIQWYYDDQLRKILNEQSSANQTLTEEMDKRELAESSLRDSETQLRRLAENTTDLVGEIRADGTVIYVSPSYYSALGYPPESLIGTNIYQLVHPDDLPIVIEEVQKAAASRTPGFVQLRIRHKNGQYIYFETSGNPLLNDLNELEGFVISSRDINSQKVAEAAQQETESKFQNIITSLPMGIHMYSLNGDSLIFTGYNPAANTILSIDHSELIGKSIEEAFPSLIGTEIPKQYKTAAQEGITWDHNQINYADDKVSGAYEVHAFQTSPGKMVAFFTDVTEKIRSAAALNLSEEKFSKAFLTSPDSININRLSDGLYIDINQGFTNLTGYTREEVVGKSSLELNIWADPADRARLVEGLRERGVVENLEAKFQYKDGSVIAGLMSARIIEVNGEMCILSVTRDISERIKAEEELRKAHDSLEEAYDATLRGWVHTLDLREHETADHSRRVVDLTMQMVDAIGIGGDERIQIFRGALLHDIGKMGVPDSILLKPGPLSSEEWTIMRYHPQYARELLERIEYLRPSMDIPYSHHEHWDGSGYPQGISGEEIPLAARIFSVVDVYDALLSNRPYRPAWKEPDVIRYLKEQKGKQFDPQIVDRFLHIVKNHTI